MRKKSWKIVNLCMGITTAIILTNSTAVTSSAEGLSYLNNAAAQNTAVALLAEDENSDQTNLPPETEPSATIEPVTILETAEIAPPETAPVIAPPETAPPETAPVIAPPETAPPVTAPPETAPPVTAPPETAPPETAPVTVPPETAPVTVPPETAPPVTVPPETAPPVTVPPETAPPETAPPETAPPETVPPETAPPETVPPVTAPPETAPPVTAPPETAPPETAPPVTAPPETVPPVTVPPETAPPVTAPPETAPPVTAPPETAPPVTAPPETAPPVTAPPETAPPETAPPVTAPPETAPPETAPPVTASPVTAPPVTAPPETAPPVTAPPETAPLVTAAPETAPLVIAPEIAPPETAAPQAAAAPETAVLSETEIQTEEAEKREKIKTFNGTKLEVASSLDGVELPDGFTKIKYTYNGKEIEALRSEYGLVLFYSYDKDNNGDFYIYNNLNESCIPYATLESSAHKYIFLDADEGNELFDELDQVKISAENKILPAWKTGSKDQEGEDDYVVYLMDETGAMKLYQVNISTGVLKAYSGITLDSEENTENTEQDEENATEETIAGSMIHKENGTDSSLFKRVAIYGAAAVALTLAILLGMAWYRRRKDNSEDSEENFLGEEQLFKDNNLNQPNENNGSDRTGENEDYESASEVNYAKLEPHIPGQQDGSNAENTDNIQFAPLDTDMSEDAPQQDAPHDTVQKLPEEQTHTVKKAAAKKKKEVDLMQQTLEKLKDPTEETDSDSEDIFDAEDNDFTLTMFDDDDDN